MAQGDLGTRLLEAIEASSTGLIEESIANLQGSVIEVDVSDIEGGVIWIKLRQASTAAEHVSLEPFLAGITESIWFQGWADGDTLTVAASPDGLGAALGFIRSFLLTSQ